MHFYRSAEAMDLGRFASNLGGPLRIESRAGGLELIALEGVQDREMTPALRLQPMCLIYVRYLTFLEIWVFKKPLLLFLCLD